MEEKSILMAEAFGYRQVVHGDGSVTLTDTETGISQRLFVPAFNPDSEPGACPNCGSYALMTNQIGGHVAGDQDYERVCMMCGQTID